MHEHGLARELWPQLQQLAAQKGLRKVARVEMVVGMLHGVSAEFLAHSFEHAFEGSSFQGAQVQIRLVEPGDQLASSDGGSTVASGFELLVTCIEGSTQ